MLCFTGNIHRWFRIDEREVCPLQPKTTETGHLSLSYTSGKSLRCLVKRQDSPPQPTDSDGSSLCGCEGLLGCTLAANCFAKDFEMDSSNCSGFPGVAAVLKGRRLRDDGAVSRET